MDATQPSRERPSPPGVSRRLAAALLLAGLALRIFALPLPGTGDVVIWKTWSYNAVVLGEPVLYGVGGHPAQRRELTYPGGDLHFAVDYPPLAVYALGLAGRAYRAFSPGMRDTAAFTAFVKLPSLVAEIGLAWVVFLGVRRLAGVGRARAAALACWLNPAVLVGGSALGYLDPLLLLMAVASIVAAAAGRTWLTGALFAAAALTKAQGVLLAPVVALAVVGATRATTGRGPAWTALRLAETAAGAALAAVVVLSPFAAAGTLPNVAAGLRSLAEHDMLSGNAANVWWIATWLIRGF
jgi:Gpi18-like mannosyltransferase